jgi:translation initiation factor 4A
LSLLLFVGFKEPSIVQQGGIVPICHGQDVILLGQSGIGKKVCFLCGILQRIDYGLLECQALILVQSPQLAQHIENAVRHIGRYLGVKVCSCVGGKLSFAQEAQRIIIGGVHVVVDTPGPILDMFHKSLLRPNHIKIFVLGQAGLLTSYSKRVNF